MSTDYVPECCTSTPLIVLEGYERVGTIKQTDKGLKYYESASDVRRTDLAVIVFYDIFGPDIAQTNQQIDRISKGLGCKAVSPYWFGVDNGYPGQIVTPEQREALHQWLEEVAGPEKVWARLNDIVDTLKSEGIMKFAAIGFCWGGMQVSELATKPGLLNAAASLHGRKYDAEKGSRIAAPFLNMASQNEGEQPDFMGALRPGIKEKSRFKLFGDVPHGFATARGDGKTNETHRRRAEEAIVEFVDFVEEVIA